MKSWMLQTAALLMMGSVWTSGAWAEKLVFETYYPSASSTSGRFRDLAVGNKKNFRDKVDPLLTSTNGEGVALIQDALGIGITALPAAALQVERTDANDPGAVAMFVGENFIKTKDKIDPATRVGIRDETGAVDWHLSANDDGTFSIHQGGTADEDRLTIDDATGNVGIGTTDLTSLLHLQQSVDSDVTTSPVALDVNSVGAAGELTAQSGTQTFARIAPAINQDEESSAGYTALLVNATETSVGTGGGNLLDLQRGGTSRMVVRSNGNVGIGTTDPEESLHVNGIIVADRAANAQSAFSVRKDGIQKWSMFVDANSSDLEFFEGDTSVKGDADVTRVVFKAGGNVGIGTANPTELLHVVDETDGPEMAFDKYFTGETDAGSPRLMLRRARGSVKDPGDVKNKDNLGTISFHGYGPKGDGRSFQRAARIRVVAGGEWTKSSTPTIMQFFTTAVGSNDDTTERMRIAADGKVGIGTASPAATLDVNGTARVVTNLRVDGLTGLGVTNPTFRLELPNTASNNGRGRANAWRTYSSVRWKENITPIEDALSKVMQLRGIYFDPKDGGPHDIGMVAEEVGKVVPELVDYEKNGGYAQSMSYDRLVALLVEAIKEQQKQIEELKARLNALE